MRDLTRARETAVIDLRAKRQQISAFLLRQGRHYAGKQTWTKAHMNWLASQKFHYPEQRLVFEEMMLSMRQAQERLALLEQAIRAAVPDWSLAELVAALMAMRGMALTSVASFLAEIGDLSLFRTPILCVMAHRPPLPREIPSQRIFDDDGHWFERFIAQARSYGSPSSIFPGFMRRLDIVPADAQKRAAVPSLAWDQHRNALAGSGSGRDEPGREGTLRHAALIKFVNGRSQIVRDLSEGRLIPQPSGKPLVVKAGHDRSAQGHHGKSR